MRNWLVAAAPCLLFAGCLYETSRNEPFAPPPKVERTFQQLSKRDPETGVVVREWTAFLEPGKRSVMHGEEIVRYASGATKWTRFYDLGEPAGEWTSWYEDGTRRSHALFAGPDEATEMSFWFPSGVLSARGPARDGVREGEWTVWHKNGVVSARGQFARSLREGEWRFWNEAGELVESAMYDAHKAVEAREASTGPFDPPFDPLFDPGRADRLEEPSPATNRDERQ